MRNQAKQPTHYEDLLMALNALRQTAHRLRSAVDDLHLTIERYKTLRAENLRDDLSASGAPNAPDVAADLVQVHTILTDGPNPPK